MLEGIEVHDGAVTAICHVLRETAEARIVVPSFVVAGLGEALDFALDAGVNPCGEPSRAMPPA
jgi:hypothetical protein